MSTDGTPDSTPVIALYGEITTSKELHLDNVTSRNHETTEYNVRRNYNKLNVIVKKDWHDKCERSCILQL